MTKQQRDFPWGQAHQASPVSRRRRSWVFRQTSITNWPLALMVISVFGRLVPGGLGIVSAIPGLMLLSLAAWVLSAYAREWWRGPT